jgi:hypothetical protein
LELTLERGGASLSLGMNGIDVGGGLYNTVKHGLDYAFLKHSNTVDKQQRNLLITDYLTGDWTAENTSMRIGFGSDKLEIIEAGKLGKNVFGETIRKDSGKGRLITIEDMGDPNTNAIMLQHEAYRDGYKTDDNEAETIAAVLGHTAMALRMIQDGEDFKLNGILLNDLMAYFDAGGGTDAFARYVLENYDSSGDFWKLMNDGTLVNDKKGWLVDEEGNPIRNSAGKQIGADGIETGLLNILYGGTSGRSYSDFTDNQVLVAQTILRLSAMVCLPGATDSPRDRTWNTNAEGVKLNMNAVMKLTKDTLANVVFSKLSPGTDRYAENNTVRAGIESYVYNSPKYQELTNKLNHSSLLTTTERMDLISRLDQVRKEAIMAYIYDQLPAVEKASRKIYEKDFVNAQERLRQLQGSQSANTFGPTLAITSLILAGGQYVWGHENPFYAAETGVDCSGAILFSLQLMGYDLDRGTANTIITKYANKVTTGGILPGDINAQPDKGGIVHVQTLTGGTGRVDPYGGELNILGNPGNIKYRTTALPKDFDVYRLDLSKLRKYYNPSLDIMSGKLTVSQFNAAWERIKNYNR